jgi:DNA-binding PadR family transcriptional regulator
VEVGVDDLTELLKGVLEGAVLEILARGDSYGYEIVRTLGRIGFASVSEGTVYPILVRLTKKGFVDVAKVPSDLGPPRKIYHLNAVGRTGLDQFWQRWDYVTARLAAYRKDQDA